MRTVIVSILFVLITAFGFYIKDNRQESNKFNQSTHNFHDDEAEVMAAAQDGLQRMLNAIPAGYERLYGFENRGCFGLAELGSPYRVYCLSTDFLKIENPGLKDYLIPLDLWRVPILVNGIGISLLTVEKDGNSWKVVDLGGAGLAKELSLFEENFAQYPGHRILLRLYQIQCDFLIDVKNNTPVSEGTFYPLQSAKIVFQDQDWLEKSSCSLDELAPLIKMKYTESFKYESK